MEPITISTLVPIILTAAFKVLPLWQKVVVIVIGLLLITLIIGIIIAIILISFSFISSGIWKSLPPQVYASIVSGIFAIITFILGNSLIKQREIKSTFQLKKIESKEKLLAKKTEFYIDFIDKLITLTKAKEYTKIDKLFEKFYGNLYIQASPEIISSFLQLVNTIETNRDDQDFSETNIQIMVDNLIAKILEQLNRDRKNISLSYSSLIFDE